MKTVGHANRGPPESRRPARPGRPRGPAGARRPIPRPRGRTASYELFVFETATQFVDPLSTSTTLHRGDAAARAIRGGDRTRAVPRNSNRGVFESRPGPADPLSTSTTLHRGHARSAAATGLARSRGFQIAEPNLSPPRRGAAAARIVAVPPRPPAAVERRSRGTLTGTLAGTVGTPCRATAARSREVAVAMALAPSGAGRSTAAGCA